MTPARPPAADDDEAYIFVDHREEEESIVRYVSERVAADDALTPRLAGESLFVTFRSREHRLPLTISRHDRYVAISSLAELLKEDYRFFVLVRSLDSDTHGLLVAPVSEAQAWSSLPEHLTPLQLGFDYFSQIKIPYLNHEDSAPDFAKESEGMRAGSDAVDHLITGLFTGKMGPGASAGLAKFAMTHPTIRDHPDFPKGASEREVAAEIQTAMEETMRDPEVRGLRGEMDKAMAELKALASGKALAKKPWWKFW